MAPCEHCHNLIWDHLYGLLEPAEATALRTHLESCPSCQAAVAAAQKDKDLLARAATALRDIAPFEQPAFDDAPVYAADAVTPDVIAQGIVVDAGYAAPLAEERGFLASAECARFQDLLWDHVYGLLEPAEVVGLNMHLESCPACSAALVEMEADKSLVARAARPVPCVPEFSIPGQESILAFQAPPADAVTAAAPPATLPLSSPAPQRSKQRRLWPAWSAVAAGLLIAAVSLNGVYERGLGEHQAEVAGARERVQAADAQFAALQKKVEKSQAEVAVKAKAETPPLVQILGSNEVHPEAVNSVQVATVDAKGNAQPARVHLQWVDAEKKNVLHQQEVQSKGEVVVQAPPLKSLADAKLIVTAKAQAGVASAQVEETIKAQQPTHATHLALNKNTYYVGEVLFFRTLTLDRFTLKPPAESLPLTFALTDAGGRVVKQLEGQTGPGGVSGGELALTQDLISGNYTLQIASNKSHVLPQTAALEIVRDETPQIEFDRRQYKPGDTLNIGFRGGKGANPYANQAVTVNVFADGQPVPQNAYAPNFGQMQAPGIPPVSQNASPTTVNPPVVNPQVANPQSVNPQGATVNNANQQNQNGQYFAGPAPVQTRLDALGNSANIQLKLPPRIEKNAEIVIQFHDGKKDAQLKQSVPVIPSANAIDFFPEGGDLVAGVPNKVYYRVRSTHGDAVAPEGRVIVLASKEVLFDSEPQQEAGYFTFVPDAGETYTVRLTGSEGIAEINQPFKKLGIQASGVVLHVAEAVGKEGQPLAVTLANKGPARKLLLQVTCRGQMIEQRHIVAPANAAEVKLQLSPQAAGVLRLTLFQAEGNQLTPVAERLVFRLPARALDVTCSSLNGAGPFLPGQQNMRLRFKATNELKEAESVWGLAAVVDEKWRDKTETGLPAQFFLAGEFDGEELANANIVLSDTQQARAELDLFLGTQGWRRFVKSEPAQFAKAESSKTKLANEKLASLRNNDVSDPVQANFFSKQSDTPQGLQQEYQRTIEREIAILLDKARKERADLLGVKELEVQKLELARLALTQYEQLPRTYFRAALGMLTVLLLAGGGVFLLFGLYRIAKNARLHESEREREPTLSFAGAFCCLFACLVLYMVGGRLATLVEGTRPGPLAELERSWPEFAANNVDPNRRAPTVGFVQPLPVQVALAKVEQQREVAAKMGKETRDQNKYVAADKGGDKFDKKDAAEAEKQKEAVQARATLLSALDLAKQQGRDDKAQESGLALSPDMANRFSAAKNLQEQKGKDAKVGPQPKAALADPRSKKSSPVKEPAKSDRTVAGSGGLAKKLDETQKSWSYQYFREYAHRAAGRAPDLQPTLLWAPALFADKGEAEVNFDLSQNLANYRVLFFANSASGRVGFYQGHLQVQPQDK